MRAGKQIRISVWRLWLERRVRSEKPTGRVDMNLAWPFKGNDMLHCTRASVELQKVAMASATLVRGQSLTCRHMTHLV
jgi:hypothetical protein